MGVGRGVFGERENDTGDWKKMWQILTEETPERGNNGGHVWHYISMHLSLSIIPI